MWLRYHPVPCTSTLRLHGPTGTMQRLGAASSEHPGKVDDISDVIEVSTWEDGGDVQIGGLTVRTQRMWHPCEAYGLRITDDAGTTLVYTGDTALCDDVVELARGASVAAGGGVVDPWRRPARGRAHVGHRGRSARP